MLVHSVVFQTANGKVKKAEESRTLAQVCSLLHPCKTQPWSPLWYSAGLFFLLRAQKSPWIIQKTDLVSFNKGTEFGSHGCLGWCLKPLVENVLKLLWWKVQLLCKLFIYFLVSLLYLSFVKVIPSSIWEGLSEHTDHRERLKSPRSHICIHFVKVELVLFPLASRCCHAHQTANWHRVVFMLNWVVCPCITWHF